MSSRRLMQVVENAAVSNEVCDQHGAYESRHIEFGSVNHWSGCPACSEEKIQREQAEEFAEKRREAAQKRMERMVGYACLPPRFAGKTFDTYHPASEQQQRHLERCKSYAESFTSHVESGDGLMLLGNPGTGKTHLAVATLIEVMRTHRAPGLYTTAARMFRRIKDTFNNRDESESQAIEAFTSPALLVLDEIGVSFGSDVELNYLFDVMNERYEQCRPTIIVSNVQPTELGRWMGDRVVDRLRECSKLMVFDWDSVRRDLGRSE